MNVTSLPLLPPVMKATTQFVLEKAGLASPVSACLPITGAAWASQPAGQLDTQAEHASHTTTQLCNISPPQLAWLGGHVAVCDYCTFLNILIGPL